MADKFGLPPENERPHEPGEGVRIIGPEEAAEAMERGDVVGRRSTSQRYGQRPPPPPDGPRPVLRFPLDASADPQEIEKPPVRPPMASAPWDPPHRAPERRPTAEGPDQRSAHGTENGPIDIVAGPGDQTWRPGPGGDAHPHQGAPGSPGSAYGDPVGSGYGDAAPAGPGGSGYGDPVGSGYGDAGPAGSGGSGYGDPVGSGYGDAAPIDLAYGDVPSGGSGHGDAEPVDPDGETGPMGPGCGDPGRVDAGYGDAGATDPGGPGRTLPDLGATGPIGSGYGDVRPAASSSGATGPIRTGYGDVGRVDAAYGDEGPIDAIYGAVDQGDAGPADGGSGDTGPDGPRPSPSGPLQPGYEGVGPLDAGPVDSGYRRAPDVPDVAPMDDAVPSGGRLGSGGIFSSRSASTGGAGPEGPVPDLGAHDPAQDGGPIDLIPAASVGGPDDRGGADQTGADQTGPGGPGDDDRPSGDLADRFANVAGEVAPRFQQSPVVDIREPQAGQGDQPDPTTSLPHWTEPPTGEVPAVFAADRGEQEADDLDAWSSFAGSSPRWRDSDDDWDEERFDDLAAMPGGDLRVGALDDAKPTHDEVFSFADLEREANTGRTRIVDPYADPELDREPPDLTFGQPGEPPGPDVYGAEVPDEGPLEGRRRRRRERKRRRASEMYDDDEVHDPESPLTPEPDPVPRGPRPRRRAAEEPPNGGQLPGVAGGGPDWGMRIAVGLGLVAVLSIAFAIGPPVALALVTAVLGVAALEFFNTLRKVGYQPAVFPGLVATVLMPIAVYNADGGPSAALGTMALVLTMTVLFGLLWYLVGADGGTGRVVEGLGLTLLGVGWIGMLGSFVAVMLRFEHGRGMVLAAIIVTVAYDVGGLVVGRSAGADGHPLSAVSPNKTREGLAGGVLMILFVGVLIIGFLPGIEPFDGFGNALKLCLLAVLAAPLGDLCESLVKRDLGVKDMGTLLPAHGGLLDRIDGLLFVMPATYFCMVLFDLGPFAG